MDYILAILFLWLLITAFLNIFCLCFVPEIWYWTQCFLCWVRNNKGYLWKRYVALKKPAALPIRGFTNGEVLYTWEDWDRDNKAEYPFRYWLTETFPTYFYGPTRWVSTAAYWLRTHTYNRYHILDLRNPEYDWGWRDVSECILYAPFNLLKQFVEKERPDETIEWNATEEHAEAWSEICSLYDWWTKRRWAEHAEMNRLADEDWAAYCDSETALKETDDLMLARLINIRHYLWT